ncbi:MAG: hypothetical protein ACOYOK_12820 [Pseudobdellovibrionaceae bacterium]
MKLSIYALICILSFVGCTKEKIIEKIPLENEQKNTRFEISSTATAEELALAGEQLVSMEYFPLANQIFSQALEKDPNNFRAQFYSKMLQRLTVFKGFAKRLRPFAKNYGDLQKFDKAFSNWPESSLKTFFYNGPEDIENESQAMDLLVSYRDAVNDFRLFLKENKNQNITLNLNTRLFEQKIQDRLKNDTCRFWEESTEGRKKLPGNSWSNDNNNKTIQVECDYTRLLQVKVNPADLMALRQTLSAEVFYYTIYTSYELEGFHQLLLFKEKYPKASSESIQNFVETKLPKMGKLRKDHKLNLFNELGSDYLSAFKSVLENQRTLCPSDAQKNGKLRPGYLFETGLCSNHSNPYEHITQVENALNDVLTFKGITQAGQEKEVVLDLKQFFGSPVKDLRQLTAQTYNRCGDPLSLKDPTWGGLFVNSDAEDFMISAKKECH